MKPDFDQAVNFMSVYVSSRHFEAQSKYANCNNGQRRNVSATGSDGDRGGVAGAEANWANAEVALPVAAVVAVVVVMEE